MPSDMNTQRKEVPPNGSLSDLDKAYMLINYPRASAAIETPEWTFEYALEVAGVIGDAKQSILDAPSIDLIRQRFALWRITGILDPVSADDDLDPSHGVAAGPEGKRQRLWEPGNVIRYQYQQRDPDGRFTIRRHHFRGALVLYSRHANLQFLEVPYDPNSAIPIDVYVWIEDPYIPGRQSWSLTGTDVVYKDSAAVRAARATYPGGNDETTLYIDVPPTAADPSDAEFISHICHHEIGHMLGLLHEHEGPRTRTNDPKDPMAGLHTEFDEDSIMIYAGHPLRVSWSNPFGTRTTKRSDTPSPTDLAFLTVSACPRLLLAVLTPVHR